MANSRSLPLRPAGRTRERWLACWAMLTSKPATEHRVAGGAEEIVMQDPGGETPARDVRAPGQGAPAAVVGDPAAHQFAGGAAGALAADGPQVPQPVEAVHRLAPGIGGADRVPDRDGVANGLAAEGEDALDDGAAPLRIAGPDVAADGRAGCARHPSRQQPAIEGAAEHGLAQAVPQALHLQVPRQAHARPEHGRHRFGRPAGTCVGRCPGRIGHGLAPAASRSRRILPA